MKKYFPILVAVAIALSSLNAEAARRLGGGRSFGQQSSQVTQREAVRPQAPVAPAQQAAPRSNPATTAAATTPARRPWGAMLGGLAAGLGLAWLAHSLGMGEGFGQVLLIMLLALGGFMLLNMFLRGRRGGASQMAYQGAGASAQEPASFKQYNPAKVGNDASARPWESEPAAFDAGGSMIGSALSGPQGWGIPADFDTAGFVSAAKRNFITLQDAWDRADISTLRSMMTDAMVHEISNQLSEREANFPGQANKTEVLTLDAQLLGIEDLGESYMASVEFNGVIREEPAAAPTPFREVWNMSKPKQGGTGWLVGGVQALQ